MEEREALQLGSLLHDIGKLLQRTESVRLSNEERSLESTCCPIHTTYKGRYSHTHVLYTQKFFNELWPDRFSLAEILAVFHHRPDTCTQSRLAKMISLADRLSSGERQSLDEEDGLGNPRTARLHSIFSSLRLPTASEHAAYFPLLPLGANLDKHFPLAGATIGEGESYDCLWSEMAVEVKRLNPASEFSHFYTQVHHLLEKYALFVPSAAYRDRADVSLFHHSKATTAIATCLYDLGLSELELDTLLTALRGDPNGVLEGDAMWLVGADVSGIQDFIYGIVSKKGLKGLRGRSAYLQLLAEAGLLRLLSEFRLTCSNLIYAGGGHFYLLVPNTPGSVDTLEKCRKHIDEVLVRAHQGQLSLSLAWETLRYNDFLPAEPQVSGQKDDSSLAGFSGAWNRLGAKLAREKRAKFSSIFSVDGGLGRIMGPFPSVGTEKTCDICGEPLKNPEHEDRCPLCSSFETLSSRLVRACSISLLPVNGSLPAGSLESYDDVIEALGCKVKLLRAGETDPRAFLLNNTDFTSTSPPFGGFHFLAKHTPMVAGDIATLEYLADEASGIKKWGVLRADVDHLGKVFRDGLQGSDQSISRVSMLSYLLSLYFSAHVEHLALKESYESTVSIVYSGGDDLFALGSWSVLKDFAQEVYHGFRYFTANRLTLSAGVFLAPGTGYPVSQAGKKAGEEELLAKNSGRNRFAVFEEAIEWQHLPELKKIEDILVRLIGDKAPRSLFTLLYQAFDAQAEVRRGVKRGEILLFPVWRLLYGFRRLIERQNKLRELVMNLESLIIKNLWLPEHAVIAVRLADYLTRQGEKGER